MCCRGSGCRRRCGRRNSGSGGSDRLLRGRCGRSNYGCSDDRLLNNLLGRRLLGWSGQRCYRRTLRGRRLFRNHRLGNRGLGHGRWYGLFSSRRHNNRRGLTRLRHDDTRRPRLLGRWGRFRCGRLCRRRRRFALGIGRRFGGLHHHRFGRHGRLRCRSSGTRRHSGLLRTLCNCLQHVSGPGDVR